MLLGGRSSAIGGVFGLASDGLGIGHLKFRQQGGVCNPIPDRQLSDHSFLCLSCSTVVGALNSDTMCIFPIKGLFQGSSLATQGLS